MDWLNFHHLLYFWTVAREGSITAACDVLSLAPSTISGQIRQLEESLGQPLFRKAGRGLTLTEFGTHIYRYAEEIFTVGHELMDFVQGRPVGGPVRFEVGVTEVVPKLVVRKIIEPALKLEGGVHLVVREGHIDELLADLTMHHLDLVLTDAPVGPETHVKAFNHLLGECGVGIFGARDVLDSLEGLFPSSLHGAPMLMPTGDAVHRRLLDQWLDRRELHPRIIGEFQDAAQLQSFGAHGHGLFPAPLNVRADLEEQFEVELLGVVDGIHEKFYAITIARTVKHPSIVTLFEAAREHMFD